MARPRREAAELSERQLSEASEASATDPGAARDFQAFSRQTGNELLGTETLDKEFIFFLKRK